MTFTASLGPSTESGKARKGRRASLEHNNHLDDLYLSGMWLGVGVRNGTKKIQTFERDWTACLEDAIHCGFNI